MGGSRKKLLMITMMVVNMIEPYLQKIVILLNSKGYVTGVKSTVIRVQTVEMVQRILSFHHMADVGSVLRKDISCMLVSSLKRRELSLTKPI